MATPLDLEEQEQLDQLKHFWNKYGTTITYLVMAAAFSFIAWNGWQYYQRDKAARAAVLYDEIERSAQAGDAARIERALGEMKDRFAGTAYAQQAGLLAARTLNEKGNADASRAALTWVSEHAIDPAYQAVARLRLAAELMQAKSYDEALKQLSAPAPKEFEALVADRRGDILLAQGKRDEARAEYQKAWTAMEPRNDYRRLVEFKLNAVGVDPRSLAPTPAGTASSAKATTP
jgi:predicted negative regulator of RcsB-dependent stress response